jgi:hypothetical protein
LNITRQYNKARAMVLAGGYDALLCVESDMIVPPDTLTRLVACESDVAYGLYVFRHTKHTWSAYTSLADATGRSLSDDADEARSKWGAVLDVAGVGLGCTLVKRNVLEQIDFRLAPDAPDKTACDWLFSIDCQANGFAQRCDTGLVCGHQSYKPYPMVLWPDITAEKLYRRESLPGVKMEPIKAGDTFGVGLGELVLSKAAMSG